MNQRNKQEAKVALVTGGARRIGAAIIKQAHQAGYKVVIHCHHSLNEAQALAAGLNAQHHDSAFVLQRDLTELNAATEIISIVENWAGRLDLLVNNASIFIRTEMDSFNNADWDALFNANVKAPYLLSLAARSLLARHQSSIINVTDIHAATPLKSYMVYCQSKAALEMQTKALAREFAPQIRVNAVAPGAIIWPEAENSLDSVTQEKIIASTPLKREGNPQYIAQAILALAENPFITGQTLKVDGGRSV